MKPRGILKEWIKAKHDGQFIKKTHEPYIHHLTEVADTVKKLDRLAYEIALCHDLLEDTHTTAKELEYALISFGYDVKDATFISNCVIQLTDVFTKKAYPQLAKADRKAKEASRLSTISPISQTVKYADLLYNIAWVLKFKHHKASGYLQRKKALLFMMDKGDAKLKKKLLKVIDNAL